VDVLIYKGGHIGNYMTKQSSYLSQKLEEMAQKP